MSAVNIDPSQKVLFAVNPIDRLGDLGAAVKVAKAFVERKIIENGQVEVRSKSSDPCFECDPFKIEPLIDQKGYTIELIEIPNVALQVIVSVSGKGEGCHHLKRKGVKTLSLGEYGFEADPIPALNSIYRSLSLGLSEKRIGIYIEPDWEAQHQLTTRDKRMQQLSQTSPETQRRVQGNLENYALYFGYSSNDTLRLGFVNAVLQLNQGDENIVFVLPRLEMSTAKVLSEIRKNENVGQIIISDGHKEEIHQVSNEGRTIKVCVGNFSHSDLRFITQASEPEVLTTGDQTVSEAISANKQFCYEERDFKGEFADSLNTLFRKFSNGYPYPTVKEDYGIGTQYYSQKLLNIFDPDLRETFSQFNKHVCETRNCFPVIERHALEMINSTEKPRVVYLFDVDEFDPTKLEDGTIYFLNLGQILSMEIDYSGDSHLPELKGKKYETRDLQESFYLIQTST